MSIVDEVPLEVLALLRLTEAVLVRRLEADEHRGQSGLGAQLQHLTVLRDVDRELRQEQDASMLAAIIPLLDREQELSRACPVHGVVVIGPKDRPGAHAIQEIQLGQHASGLLVTLLAPGILDDIAELTFERAARRRLQGAHDRAFIGVELPAGHRGRVEIGFVADVRVLVSGACEGVTGPRDPGTPWARVIADTRSGRASGDR